MELIVKILADGLVLVVALLGVYALVRYVPNSQKYNVYTRVLMAGLTAYVAAKIAGFIFQPEGLRPFEQMGVQAGASFLNNPGFPSDHALFTAAIVLAIWFGTKNKLLTVAAFTMMLLVAIGRVLALVHTPLDVIGGMVIACVGVVWYIGLNVKKQNKA